MLHSLFHILDVIHMYEVTNVLLWNWFSEIFFAMSWLGGVQAWAEQERGHSITWDILHLMLTCALGFKLPLSDIFQWCFQMPWVSCGCYTLWNTPGSMYMEYWTNKPGGAHFSYSLKNQFSLPVVDAWQLWCCWQFFMFLPCLVNDPPFFLA